MEKEKCSPQKQSKNTNTITINALSIRSSQYSSTKKGHLVFDKLTNKEISLIEEYLGWKYFIQIVVHLNSYIKDCCIETWSKEGIKIASNKSNY